MAAGETRARLAREDDEESDALEAQGAAMAHLMRQATRPGPADPQRIVRQMARERQAAEEAEEEEGA